MAGQPHITADAVAEGVVHRLVRDGTDLDSDGFGHGVGRDVGLTHDRPQDSQSLGRDLNTALPKEVSGVGGHIDMVSNN